MMVILTYLDSREPTSTMVSSDVLRHADLPALASRLVSSLPRAARVRILDANGEPLADTGGVPCPT
ncbi:hypothetical protein FrEUN1fDRAFT_0374 [Parafrankia sp. EUN1f]|nr:hypothetical protein FrEUN1fDRAFT_0374 [Parafrankia sp. EUN1f]